MVRRVQLAVAHRAVEQPHHVPNTHQRVRGEGLADGVLRAAIEEAGYDIAG